MDISFYCGMTYKELQSHFKKYLEQQDRIRNTNSATTYFSDGLYLYRKGGAELFWNTVTCSSEQFEEVAYNNLFEQLKNNSSSNNIEKNIDSYQIAIRKFREFVYGK